MDYRPQMPYTPNPYYPNTIPPCAATNPGFYALPEVIPGLAQKNPLFNAITQGEARPSMMLPSADANQPDAAVGTGSMPMTVSPTTGMQNPMGSPSTLASLPTEAQVGVTGSSLQFLNGFLRTQIGRKVMVEFLIGTNTLVDRSGILVAVGTNYILINESETDDLLACDYYNIKFVRFYY